MEENPENWKEESERNKRWVNASVVTKNEKHKVYVLYDGENENIPDKFKKAIESNFSSREGWRKEIISTRQKAQNLLSRIDKGKEHIECGCGKKEVSTEIQQTAQIVHNPPSNK